jgi:LacI family transcriptional regulator
LHKSHIPVVGVIVHDITDPYFADVVRGVEDAAAVGGFLVVTCSSDRIA